MASSSQTGDPAVCKGDSLNVEVTEVFGDLISVRLVSGSKAYQGVLLQENPSYGQHGVNQERIRGTPLWPPLTSPITGINLKTIPCSTERYSYKVEGQPSCLNVFQPETIKRSNRNQPAPQLSRILRPRRFVCRKCKKAYHVKENGTEMSSGLVPSQPDQESAVDSSAANSDTEVAETTFLHTNGKALRRNQNSILSADSVPSTIKHVTPSIIPKLNEDYAFSGRESEVESNSDDTLIGKRGKTQKLDKLESSYFVVDAAVQPKRRITHSLQQRPKKSKKSLTVTDPADEAKAELTSHIIPPLITNEIPVNIPSTQAEAKSLSSHLKQTDSSVRKNRIKAQYVSVATPFRFPPSRSSKPNLLAASKLSNVPKDRDWTSKRSRETKSQAFKTDTKRLPPDTPAAPPFTQALLEKTSISRYRTRARPSTDQTTHSFDQSPATSNDVNNNIDSQTLSKSNQPHSSVCTEKVNIAIDDQTMVSRGQDVVIAKVSTSRGDRSGNDSDSLPDAQGKNSITSRPKSTDYEKPKNRWMREARARRSQEDRTSVSLFTGISTSALSGIPTTNSDPSNSNVCNNSSIASRSRSKPPETTSNDVQLSPKSATASKKRNTQHVSSVPTISPNPADDNQSVAGNQTVAATLATTTTQQLSPHTNQSSETAGVSLPVLKIKINRQHQYSNDLNNSTQYEVIGPKVCDDNAHRDSNHSDESSQCNIQEPSSVVDNLDQKIIASTSGPWTSSLTLSVSSSKKGCTSTDFGPEVKKCKLLDGTVFRVGDLVWSKLTGWPSWPAQITSIHEVSAIDNESKSGEPELCDNSRVKSILPNNQKCSFVACLHWFAWHQVSYMPCDKLFHFLQHYKRFDNKKKRGVFRQAVNEAKQKSDEKKTEFHDLGDSDSTGDLELNVTSDSREKPASETQSVVEVINSVDQSETKLPIIQTIQSQSESSVVSTSIEHSQPITTVATTPTSIPVPPVVIRRGAVNRGHKSGLRGRRGGSTKTIDRVRSSPRALPLFTPNDVTVHQGLSVQKRKAGRGRGEIKSGRARIKSCKEANLCTPTTDQNTYVISEPKGSSGTLKIVLSTAKLKPRHFRFKDSQRRNVRAKKHVAHPVTTLHSEPEVSTDVIATSASIPATTEPAYVRPEHNDSNPDMYADASADLLSQFPNVFPDLRASGILSDAVDIPTFSEDESEEEDVGRLIIDPDVISSVNSSDPLSTATMEVNRATSSHKTVPQEYYDLPSYFSEFPEKEPVRVSVCNSYPFMPVPHSRFPDTVFTPASNPTAPTTLYNIPTANPRLSNLPPPTGSSNQTSSTLMPQTSPHLPHGALQQLPHHSFDAPPMDNRLSSYFRPSQVGAPVTPSSNAVPYISSEYPNR